MVHAAEGGVALGLERGGSGGGGGRTFAIYHHKVRVPRIQRKGATAAARTAAARTAAARTTAAARAAPARCAEGIVTRHILPVVCGELAMMGDLLPIDKSDEGNRRRVLRRRLVGGANAASHHTHQTLPKPTTHDESTRGGGGGGEALAKGELLARPQIEARAASVGAS